MIYFVQAGEDGPVKIGFCTTRRHFRQRFEALQCGNPRTLRVLAVVPGDREDESLLHLHFGSDRLRGEWFRPSAELFAVAYDPMRFREVLDHMWSLGRFREWGILDHGGYTYKHTLYMLGLERYAAEQGINLEGYAKFLSEYVESTDEWVQQLAA